MQNPIIQQVVEALRGANNVLITVKNSPSVDELTASIALTLILNHMNKHATTVFSGKVPSTIEFLQPEMAIESNTDSLRDFIIALDKSKADKLRYKVEDNVVRIFITPYKSSISEADLEFSQGDFNVDVVVALGVLSRDDFDQAVMAHGRILHDATVIAITNEPLQQDVGVVNWQDPEASSISEMVARITDLFGTRVMDSQIATALLTGIVAETDRFKNERTTPQVLSISSTLMTEGANQMLIAEELEQPQEVESQFQPLEPLSLDGDSEQSQPNPDGTLSVPHDQGQSVGNIDIDDQGNINTFGAVGDSPVDTAQHEFAMPPLEEVPSEHDTLPQLPQIPPSPDGEERHDENVQFNVPAPESIVSERPYLETPKNEHRNDDEAPLSEATGLFGNSLHDVSSPQGGEDTPLLARGPKVVQPPEQHETTDAVHMESPAAASPGSMDFAAPTPSTDALQPPLPDTLFAPSGHTEDMPGEYQTVTSDPVAPYSPPPSVHHDADDHQDPAAQMPVTDDAALDQNDVLSGTGTGTQGNDERQTLADIEARVGSHHVAEAAGLPKPPSESTGGEDIDDFIGSVRTPQPSAELPVVPGTGVPQESEKAIQQPPVVSPDEPAHDQSQTAPEPVVVEPYQPPAPLHEAEKHADPNSPPQVPPPLTMPQANSSQPVFYDPNGNKENNPLINPS